MWSAGLPCICACSIPVQQLCAHRTRRNLLKDKAHAYLACHHHCAEEVYACEFLAAQDKALCTASDDSLFLWDLDTGRRLQRAPPPSVPADELAGTVPGGNSGACTPICARSLRP